MTRRDCGAGSQPAAPRFVSALRRILTGLACASLSFAQTPSPDKPLLAEQVFKNIQVLKGIPVDDFMQTMGLMTAALQFDCSDCHPNAGTDSVDWAADTPRKRTARRMVTMVTKINNDNFGGRQMVTCWSCHRNRDTPLVTPNMETIYSMPSLESDDVVAPTPGLPSPESILDRFIEVSGGAQRLAALTSFVGKGTSVGFGGFGGGGDVEIITNLKTGPPNIIMDLPAPESQSSLQKDLTSGQTHSVNIVQGTGSRGLLVTLYFDKQTGLLLRELRYGNSPIGRVPTQIDYTDYRDVNGIKLPFRITYAWLDGRDSIVLNEIKTNVPVDEAKFGRPAPLKR